MAFGIGLRSVVFKEATDITTIDCETSADGTLF